MVNRGGEGGEGRWGEERKVWGGIVLKVEFIVVVEVIEDLMGLRGVGDVEE